MEINRIWPVFLAVPRSRIVPSDFRSIPPFVYLLSQGLKMHCGGKVVMILLDFNFQGLAIGFNITCCFGEAIGRLLDDGGGGGS